VLTTTFQTAETVYPKSSPYPLPPNRAAEYAPRLWWQHPDVDKFLPTEACASAVYAEVNQGRWVVVCECGAAQLASKTDPRFFCIGCLNETNACKWRPVIFPADVPGIEAALLPRPTTNANALPGETVTDLLAENEVNGCGLDSA
jgi:hypothetical protein